MMQKRFVSLRMYFWSVARLLALELAGESLTGSLIKQCRCLQAVKMFQVPVVKQECYQHTNGFILNKGGLALLLNYSASNSS